MPATTALTLEEVAKEGCTDEATDLALYTRLSTSHRGKNQIAKEALANLAKTEQKHFALWKKYCPAAEIKPNGTVITLILFLRTILGTTFAIKFLEKHEKKTVEKYKAVAHLIPPEDKPMFDEMVRDEEEHEQTFANQTQGAYLKYISFIILGLADAIVEISGIHAGSLGIYRTTEITGLAGIVAGAAASIAMASAAYAQAKQGFQGNASVSAVFTGISYFVSAVILASPYFLTRSNLTAIVISMILATLIIAFVTYYNSIISDSSFVRDFAELAGIMLGATVALFFFGTLVHDITHITISSA